MRVGRIDVSGKVIEKVGVVGQMGALAGHESGDIAVSNLAEQGNHLVTDPIASMHRAEVRRIGNRGETESGTHRFGVATPEREEGVPRPTHPGETVQPGTPDQSEKHGLGLVIGCMAGEDPVRERCEAGLTGTSFEIRPGADTHREPLRWNPESISSRDHDVEVGCGAGPQPVIDVPGGDVEIGRDGQREQRQ